MELTKCEMRELRVGRCQWEEWEEVGYNGKEWPQSQVLHHRGLHWIIMQDLSAGNKLHDECSD